MWRRMAFSVSLSAVQMYKPCSAMPRFGAGAQSAQKPATLPTISNGKYILTSPEAFGTMRVTLCESVFCDLLCISRRTLRAENLNNLEGGYL